MSGKGCARRPRQVSEQVEAANWRRTFGTEQARRLRVKVTRDLLERCTPKEGAFIEHLEWQDGPGFPELFQEIPEISGPRR